MISLEIGPLNDDGNGTVSIVAACASPQLPACIQSDSVDGVRIDELATKNGGLLPTRAESSGTSAKRFFVNARSNEVSTSLGQRCAGRKDLSRVVFERIETEPDVPFECYPIWIFGSVGMLRHDRLQAKLTDCTQMYLTLGKRPDNSAERLRATPLTVHIKQHDHSAHKHVHPL